MSITPSEKARMQAELADLRKRVDGAANDPVDYKASVLDLLSRVNDLEGRVKVLEADAVKAQAEAESAAADADAEKARKPKREKK